MDIKNNRDYYNEFSRKYDKGRDRGYHALLDSLEIDFLKRFARGKHVLEAGCGTGLILDRSRPHLASSIGIDLSEGMLRHASRRGHRVLQAEITRLPFKDNSFDVVASFKVVAHVEQIKTAILEMARVTKNEGILILEFYNPYSFRGLIKKLGGRGKISEKTTDKEVYTRYDSYRDIKSYLPSGCKIVDSRGIFIITPFSLVHRIPLADKFFSYVDSKLADSVLRFLGGFFIVAVEVKKTASTPFRK